MTKMLETKKMILSSLEERNKTMSELSSELGLANSTVSKHLKELEMMGAIRDTGEGRKWKYYQKNKDFNFSQIGIRHGNISKLAITVTAAVALIVIAALILYSSASSVALSNISLQAGSAVPNGVTVMAIEDAPQFYNITALNITVTQAILHSTSGKNYIVNVSKRIDLVKLSNTSEIFSAVKLPYGNYTGISLIVSNATAVVSGNATGVFVPSSKIEIPGKFTVSQNMTNWLLLDFNLEQSLHFTGNGRIIMLPVIYYSGGRNANITVGRNSSPIFRNMGHVEWNRSMFGMDQAGKIENNFSIPLNQSMGIESGRIVLGPRFGASFFVVRRGLIGAFVYNSPLPFENGTFNVSMVRFNHTFPFNISDLNCSGRGMKGAMLCTYRKAYNATNSEQPATIINVSPSGARLYVNMFMLPIIGAYNTSVYLTSSNGTSFGKSGIITVIPDTVAMYNKAYTVEFNGLTAGANYSLAISSNHTSICIPKQRVACVRTTSQSSYSINFSVISNVSSISIRVPGSLISSNGVSVLRANASSQLGSSSNFTFPSGRIIINSTAEASEAKPVAPSLPLAAYNCSVGTDCMTAPVTICQNGLPNQQICVNQSYYGAYMSDYKNFTAKSAGSVCPMFIIRSSYSCGCSGSSCGMLYSQN